MFSIKKLVVQSKDGKNLVSVENLNLALGTISLLLGKNGSGKTSLLHGLFLHPSVGCVARNISLDKQDISDTSLIEMYHRGMHYIPQNLLPLPGVSFLSLLHIAFENKFTEKMFLIVFAEKVKKICNMYGLPDYLLEKNVHENLSGGERKMQELIQVLVLKPKYLFLDEIDAGLDRDAKNIVVAIINGLKKDGVGIILVSHSFEFTEHISVDQVYVMNAGNITHTGDATMLRDIKKDGFTE